MIIRIETLDDPRVASYRNLRERTLRGESIFIAEGRLLTKRLLSSKMGTESVFVAESGCEEFQPLAESDIPLYVANERLLLEIVGFPFHRGVMAVGKRPPRLSLAELMSPLEREETIRLVICPEITKAENIGLVFRTAAGFQIDGIVLGEQCCDPLSRRCLRTSMGAVLEMPFVQSLELANDLQMLQDRWKVELFATVLADDAEPLETLFWPPRAGLLFGNESEGLREGLLAQCERRITIPMVENVDSLNLGVAAGIFVYEMQKSRTSINRRAID